MAFEKVRTKIRGFFSIKESAVKANEEWVEKLFGEDFKSQEARAAAFNSKKAEIAVREMAYEICVQRIAMAISKCEFRTYKEHKEVKADDYYRLNVQPNANQNATQFWSKFIHQLYRHHEALIVPVGDELYVADSFSKDDSMAFSDHKFFGIKIANLQMDRVYRASDVLYFKLDNKKLKRLLDSTLEMYSELIGMAKSAYGQSNGSKYKIKIDQIAENRDNFDDELDSLINEDLKTFIHSDSAAIPIYEGYDLEDFSPRAGNTTSRDIKALLDDVLEITCKAFLIPTNIVTGEVTDTSKAVDDFLTFCLDSLVELIEDELNRKLCSKSDYLKGTRIRINTQTIKHIDVLDVANSIDKLLSSGVKTINDINRILGDEIIDEEWANQHWMTKNYASIDELNSGLDPGRKEGINEGKENDALPDAAQS